MTSQSAYYRKNKHRINENRRMIKQHGPKWWLRLAFLKAGGRPEDFPVNKPEYL